MSEPNNDSGDESFDLRQGPALTKPDSFITPQVDQRKASSGGEADILILSPGDVVRNQVCWRCKLEYNAILPNCTHCHAANPTSKLQRSATSADTVKQKSSLWVACMCFLAIVSTSVVFGLVLSAQAALSGKNVQADNSTFLVLVTFAVEFVDTIIVIIAISYAGSWMTKTSYRPKTATRVVVWLIGLAAVAGLIILNLFYHQLLIDFFQFERIESAITGYFPVVLFLFCIQPAIIEELFCRQLCVTAFQDHMGIHSTVFLTAVMFGIFHIFVPLSVPYLIFVGIILGYARILSGTILLPIAMHFFHNLVVILLEKS